jgi:hypothetical protein
VTAASIASAVTCHSFSADVGTITGTPPAKMTSGA